MRNYEELKTPEAVMAAFESGRRVESSIRGGSWVGTQRHDCVTANMNADVRYRALIEDAPPAGMLNGLTEDETSATASVMGLVNNPPIPEGYTPWAGGECPEDAAEARIEYIMRCRPALWPAERGRNLRWDHDGTDGDIIAYRVESKQAQPIPGESLGRDADPLRAVVEMIAARARNFPDFPMGRHMDELFRAIGREPPTLDADDGVEALASRLIAYADDARVRQWQGGIHSHELEQRERDLREAARRLRQTVDEAMVERAAKAISIVRQGHARAFRMYLPEARAALTAALNPGADSHG